MNFFNEIYDKVMCNDFQFRYYTPNEINLIISQLYLDLSRLKKCTFWLDDCDRIGEIINFLRQYYPETIQRHYGIINTWWHLQNYLVRCSDM